MRLALQALFSTIEAGEDGVARRAWLERRLRASERSAGFARRLRDVIDDASLQAPEIFAEASYPDANVVAEYLDGQVSPETASAYEDACWGSPEALAEVGRCCDILNNDALNSVVVPKNCRRRLYYIAWEESCVSVAAEKESASTLTGGAFSATFEAGDRESETAEKTNDGAGLSKTKKKGKKSEKSPKTVGSTLAAERSLWRRGKRLVARASLALGLGGAIYCGWQALSDDKRSETFELETPKAEALAISDNLAGDGAEETPLRPTTIAGLEIDELATASLAESLSVAENDGLDDYNDLMGGAEPVKVAVLPDASNGREGKQAGFAETLNVERTRVGLGGDEPWERRPSIEIPARNNDVFTK